MNAKKQIIFISFIPMCLLTACHSSMKGLSDSKNVHLGLPALSETETNKDIVPLEEIPEQQYMEDVIHGAVTNQGRYTIVNLDTTGVYNYKDMKVEWDSINRADMISLTLENVQILGSKVRNIAERNGEVSVDFVLAVPRSLTHNKRLLSIYPVVMKEGTKDSLQEVRFTGKNFRKQQERGYEKYQDYENKIIPDTADFYTTFVDYKGFEKFMHGEERRYEEMQQEWGELNVKKNRKSLLDRRFAMFNSEQIGNEARLQEKRKTESAETGFAKWMDGRIASMPHYRLRRDTAYTKNKMERKQMKLEGEMLAFSMPDSAEAVKDFYLDKKIDRNNALKDNRDKMYRKYVKFPYNEDALLDSIVSTNDSIYYFYTHKLKADEKSSKIYLTAESRAVNYDNRSFSMPPTDTLVFIVSSMTDFVNEKTKYVEKIVKRDQQVNFSAYLTFPVGKAEVLENMGSNKEELDKVMMTSYDIITDSVYALDGIRQIAYSSPEGSVWLNNNLAARRGKSVSEYVKRRLRAMGDTIAPMFEYVFDETTGNTVKKEMENPIPGLLNRIVAESKGEDWEGLRKLIVEDASGNIKNKAAILDIMDSKMHPDRKENTIAARYPKDFRYMKENFYKRLRRVDFEFNFRRKGMLEETVVTNVPDTVYAEGLELLKKRDYEAALEKLRKYEDENTALAYMSLGYNNAAERVLDGLKDESADILYMRAIVAARLGKYRNAARFLLKSSELEPKMRFRANLDPELSELVKKYNIFGDNF